MAIRVLDKRIVPGDHSGFAASVEANLDGLKAIAEIGFAQVGIPQGYTYLGQFLAHELAPRQDVNTRTRKLDLDSLYPDFGDTEKIDSEGKFLTQAATADKLEDLIRGSDNKALIPDFRNDDQLIIAQLHLLWQRFHNHLIDLLPHHCTPIPDSPEARFHAAREFTVACFQRIIVEDYMIRLADPTIRSVLWDDQVSILEIPATEPDLPLEITHAAGRFGHSQVRSSYQLNLDGGSSLVSLIDLFNFTGEHGGAAYDRVPVEHRFQWSLFFPQPGDAREEGNKISSFIAAPLRPFVLEHNLLAGINAVLPSGQVLAQTIIEEFENQGIHGHGLQAAIVANDDNQEAREALEAMGLLEDTPIWLFILMEADASASRGDRLGPLGSTLLIETIKSALQDTGFEDYATVQARFEDCGFPSIRKMADIALSLEA